MTAAVEIRDAVLDDARALAALYRESAEAHAAMSPEFYVVPDVDETVRRAERRLAGETTTLVAVADSRVVGAVDLDPLPPPSPGSMIRAVRAVDVGIVITASYRGRGVGRALMDAAEARASRDGVQLLTLNARAENEAALRLYRSLGYTTAGVIMHRWLD